MLHGAVLADGVMPQAAPSVDSGTALVQCACDAVVGVLAELEIDELVQPFGVGFDSAGLFKLVPGVPVPWVAHSDHPDSVRAPNAAGLSDRLLHGFGALVRDVEDHVGVRGAS